MCFNFGFANQKELLQPHSIPFVVSLLKSLHTFKLRKISVATSSAQITTCTWSAGRFLGSDFLHTEYLRDCDVCWSVLQLFSHCIQATQKVQPSPLWVKVANEHTILMMSLVRIVWWNGTDIPLIFSSWEKRQWKESSPAF